MAQYAVAHLDDIDELEDGRCPFRPVRHHFGITAFGVTAWSARAAGDRILNEHGESDDGQEELYLVLEGTGRIRVSEKRFTIPRLGAILVAPYVLRQVFNDTADEALWLIVGAPRSEVFSDLKDLYPEDPKQLPLELLGHTWPPAST